MQEMKLKLHRFYHKEMLSKISKNFVLKMKHEHVDIIGKWKYNH